MLILDATTKSLEIDLAGAVSANELPVTAHYTDITTTLYTPGSNDTQTNGATAVTIVAAPAASTQRHVESISVYNADTAAATVTIQLNNNSTLRIITKVTLQAAEQLFYEDGMGWQIIDANGAVIRGTNVSDTAYASSWDGVTTIAPSKNAVYDQMLLQMLKNGSNLAIGSDADGDMYYRASGALARLAKGTANFKQFMNAAGTAPEWAAGSKIVEVTRAMTAASGDVSTSNVGFKPSALIAIHGIAATKIGGVGIADSSKQYAWTNQGALAAGQFHFSSGFFVIGWESDAKYQFGVMKTLDSSGFTITWTKSAAEPATQDLIIGVLCLR
jgi:hypothetical protein